MPRRNHIPTYRLHKQSGQAIVTLPDGAGGRHDVTLGPHGTTESRAEYARVLAEWEANGRRPVLAAATPDLTVYELVARFLEHAKQHYRRPDGTTTSELSDYKLSLRPLCHLYGHTPARDFGPLALKAVRKLMVEGYEHALHGAQPQLARKVVNQRVGRVRRLFRWAVENEMVPLSTLHGLQAVQGLQCGRSAARETEPVRPVADSIVSATLPFLRPPVAAMVRLQLLTGMRPGEVVILRAIDLERTDPVWLYRPARHKTEWHGHQRVIPIGPRGQEIIRQWLKPNVEAYLFSPADAVEGLHAERRQQRQTRIQPSQARRRRKEKPRRKPRDHYTPDTYGKAVARACQKATVPAWHPHQLRHTKATEIRREAGLDAARAVLGHRSPQVTELYAELDIAKAAAVMERIG
jgi:integrase